jgi:hypothetical protein
VVEWAAAVWEWADPVAAKWVAVRWAAACAARVAVAWEWAVPVVDKWAAARWVVACAVPVDKADRAADSKAALPVAAVKWRAVLRAASSRVVRRAVALPVVAVAALPRSSNSHIKKAAFYRAAFFFA